ncbi:phage tail tip lysozyme [Burkholderia cepacia]|uniref:phage tail tip lysozyme n=1 Tax=Burkholderia cepacia TaxID=292 RepID=UPI0026554216|nr:phage tail tip lysozyme [Burkholderia cepacia]MDN7611263.1 phage tail tip lysozyme [Burkholderia cepacia]
MAVSILKIQVDRAEADKYFEDYKKYEAALDDLPGPWKEALKNAKALDAAQAAGMKKQVSALKDSNKQLVVMGKSWDHIRSTVKGVNKDVRETLSNLSKMLPGLGTMGGLAAGAIGIPSLMFAGFAKLMQSFGGDRVTNLQMGGISQGSRMAFQNTYGRYGFGDGQLRAVAEAQRDPTKRGSLIMALRAAGISDQEAMQLSDQGTDAGEVMSRLITASRTANPIVMRAMGGQFMTSEQLTTVNSAQAGEIEGLSSEYHRQIPELDARGEDQRKALEFTSHLSEQFEKIRTRIFGRLIELEPSLDKITKAFGKLVTDVLDSQGFKRFLSELPSKINKFSEFLTSERFTNALSTVTNNLFRLAVATTRLLEGIGKLMPGSLGGKYQNPEALLKKTNENIASEESNLKAAKQRYAEADAQENAGHPLIAAGIRSLGPTPQSIQDSLKGLYQTRDEIKAQIAGNADAGIPALPDGASDDGKNLNLTSPPLRGASYVTPDGQARGPSTQDEKAQFIGEFIAEGKRRGMKPEVIAGILGSIAQESNFDVYVRNGIGAYGAAQWLDKGRQRALSKYRKQNAGKSEQWVQAHFAWQEMQGMGRLKGLNATSSVEEAAIYHRKYVEMPGEEEANDAARVRYGRQALNSYGDVLRGTVNSGGGVSVNVTVQNMTGANVTANAAAAAT